MSVFDNQPQLPAEEYGYLHTSSQLTVYVAE